MNDVEKQFYEEVKESIKDFARFAVEEIKGEKEIEFSEVEAELKRIKALNLSAEDLAAFQAIIEDAAKGAVHSIFVSIDGGTALSDDGKALDLIDRKTGKSVTDGALHENFMDVFE